MNVLLILAGLLLAVVVYDVVRHGSFRRLAVRNIVRRRSEALLVILGCMLGTAIITSSFVVGDTLDASIRDTARTQLGPVDVVASRGLLGGDELVAAVGDQAPDGSDGLLPFVQAQGVVATPADEVARRSEPEAQIGEVDFEAARAFGPDEDITGFADAGATPQGDEVVLNQRMADHLEVGEGDEVVVYVLAQERTFTVRDVVPEVGLAGFSGFFVPPGTLATALDEAVAEAGGQVAGATSGFEPTALVLSSGDGGVFDGVEHSDAIVDELEARTAPVGGVEVEPVKEDLLDQAATESSGVQGLFTGIGGFSVIAGVLLLVNLFVMLAEERKTELGMLRAVGYKRNHLMRTFAIEGAIYSILAVGLGALVGVGVGWVIVRVTQSIFAGDDPDLVFRLSVQPGSLATGALIGLVISLVTVWATSARIARLNVIAAIRDLPEPRRTGRRVRSLVLSALGVAVGALLLATGVAGDESISALVGLPIIAWSAVPLLSRLLPRKWVAVVSSAVVIVWGVGVFSLLPDAFEGSDIQVFVVQGVVLVAGAVVIASSADHLWVGLASRISATGRGLAARLGLAYPVARKFRTGMLLGMYALVIFTMTFLSTFSGIFGSQAATFTYEGSAGFDVFVDSSPGNPVQTADLEGVPGVASAVPLLLAFPDFSSSFESDPSPFAVTGIDQSFLQARAPVLSSRLDRFDDDGQAFQAVVDDPSFVVVNDYFLQEGGGPPSDVVEAGDEITMIDPDTGDEHVATVAGVFSSDFLFNGVFVQRALVEEVLGGSAVESRHYVRVADDADPDLVAEQITGALVANGADASTFRAEVDDELAENQAFFSLMRGYLGLGLLIGIAGLGVVMIRAARERRREVGMLRAMGFPATVVRRAFLLEAAFIALQGTGIGIVLGLVSSYQVLVNSDTFGEMTLPFAVPVAALLVIIVLPLLASLLAAVAPASQAATIKPAAALRMAD